MVCLYAQKYAVHFAVVRHEVMAVVCYNEGDARLMRNAHYGGVYLFLTTQAMVLQLKVKIAAPEYAVVMECGRFRAVIVTGSKVPRYFTCKACGKRYKPFMVFFQELIIYTRLKVKSFGP